LKKFWQQLKRWLFEPLPPVEKQIHIINVAKTHLRLEEVRTDQKLCGVFKKLQSTYEFEIMMSVLRNEHPVNLVADIGTTLQDRAVLQARSEGYTMALANIEAMAIYNKPTEMPEAEFAEEELTKH
jgi:hypothetical protein